MASLNKTYSKEKLTGQIFTPDWLVDKILDDIGYKGKVILKKTIVDPSCGDGQFLLEVAKRIIDASDLQDLDANLSYLHGWDIDPMAVSQCLQNLDALIKELPIAVNWNVSVRDSLDEISALRSQSSERPTFHFVIGNPPYVRIQHLDETTRDKIRSHYSFCRKGSTDLYVAFFELALDLLASDGLAAFITPNSYFFTETGSTLRSALVDTKCLVKVSNYGSIQLFENASTYSAITIFGRNPQTKFVYEEAYTKYDVLTSTIEISALKNSKTWKLSIKEQVNIDGIKLKAIAKIHVGITTLCDKAFIFGVEEFDSVYAVANTKLGGKVKIETSMLRPIIKASKFKSSSQPITEYILFPYEKKGSVYNILPEARLSKEFPKAYQYLKTVKPFLDKRDNGIKNSIAWYAFGRNQGLNITEGKKIIFSPMNKFPNFVINDNVDALFYSGYCLIYDGDYEKLLKDLNSERMYDYISISSRDFRGGWKAYSKTVVEGFTLTNI